MNKKLFIIFWLMCCVLGIRAELSDVVTSNPLGVNFNFSSSGNYAWNYDSNNKRLQSTNKGVQSSTSETTISFTLEYSSNFSFNYQVSSESGYDKFTILLDNQSIVNAISGNKSNSYSSQLSDGTHTITLSYIKDGSADNGDDRAYISNLKIEPTGKCGNNIVWTLDGDGLLTITGSGKFFYYDYSSSPFSSNGFGGFIKSVNISKGIENISSGAFWHSNIESIVIPSTVTDIGDHAFAFTNLSTIDIPSSVTSIEDALFCGCSNLTNVVLPSSITTIGERAFDRCSNLTEFDIPNSVATIKQWAFLDCSSLNRISIPKSVARIGREAFSGCTSLKQVNFASIESLCKIVFDDKEANPLSQVQHLFFNGQEIIELIIPSTITSIGDFTFSNCLGIKSVVIPSTVTYIADNAFYGCSNLRLVYNLSNLDISKGSTTHGYIARYASAIFSDLSVSPHERNNILFYDLDDCVHIYGIKENATNIDISSVESRTCVIDDYAFYNNNVVKIIVFPETVTSIGSSALNGTTPTAVICLATTPPKLGGGNKFGGSKKIYVPSESIELYKKAWDNLGSDYKFLSLTDVMFFEATNAEQYAAAFVNKDKSEVASVGFYGEMDASLTASVLKNGMNPNCLYYVPANAELRGDNIIALDDFTTDKLSLRDGYTYNCPIGFHANEVEYVHTPKVWANGYNGWETICLPFGITEYEASESGYITPILLGGMGDFWLRRFSGANSKNVYFCSTVEGEMVANTPYLLAFPGESMGTGNLEGETITFRGYDARITTERSPKLTKGNFSFVGNFDKTADNTTGWALDAAGGSFLLSDELGKTPFQAYFCQKDGATASAKSLRISFGVYDEEDGIFIPEEVGQKDTLQTGIYDLVGRKVSKTKPGLYIVNGKKQVVR